MSSRHDPLVRYEASSTEPFVVDEERRHPGILVGGRLVSANNLVSRARQSTVSWEQCQGFYNKCKAGDCFVIKCILQAISICVNNWLTEYELLVRRK